MAASSFARQSQASAIAGRSTQGVIVLNTAEDEKVVSLERPSEEEGDNGEGE